MKAKMKPTKPFIRLIIFLVFLYGGKWAFAQTNFWEQTNGPDGRIIVALAINARGDIFAGGSGVFRSTNNGDSWTAINTGLPPMTEIWSFVINPATRDIFAGTWLRGVFRSTNNGDSWTAADTGLTNVFVASLAINSSEHIFAGSREGEFVSSTGVFRSINNGGSWTAVNIGLTNRNVFSLAINAVTGDIFAGTLGDGVFRSTNNGDSWNAVNIGLANSSVWSFVINPATRDVFAGTGDGVFRLTNNSEIWTAVNTGLTNSSIWSLLINPATEDIFAGTGGGVFHSTNNGDNWIAVNTGLTNLEVTSLAINATGYIFVGTWGGGVFRSMQSTTTVKEIAAEGPSSFELMQNFPNPFNPGTRIKFHVPATSLVRLEVFNLMGQHIATLLEENRAAGEHELAWDGRSDLGQPVPSGVYLLSIRAGEFTQTRKMVLAR